ncbi:phage portal protein [Fodinicola feengrottensis]|uniref:phage portal protein n=1 Tax=Fodinicola feengrottensis TaxID=435914 RepID=UPI0013D0C978|nr:phage portal protein [Fodinicola feengrottensis]
MLTSPSTTGGLRDWLFRMITSMIYRGNAVGIIIERDNLEYPTHIEWLNPDDVFVEDVLSQLIGRGSFSDPIWYWRGVEIPTADIVHIPWFPMPYRVWGMSPMAAFATSVATGLAAQQYSYDWFKSGGVPTGTFTNSEMEVSQTDANVIKGRLVQAIRSHEPIVYGKDWTYNPVSVKPQEAQFIQTMQLTATQIASVYGVDPKDVGGDTGSAGTIKYANEEQHDLKFLRFTIMPWLAPLEEALSKLLPRGQYVKFNVDALSRPDSATRFANYQIARNIGLQNLDEQRALEDWAPIPGGGGQDYTPLPLAEAAVTPASQTPDPNANEPDTDEPGT